jgi:hypothetical protein
MHFLKEIIDFHCPGINFLKEVIDFHCPGCISLRKSLIFIILDAFS